MKTWATLQSTMLNEAVCLQIQIDDLKQSLSADERTITFLVCVFLLSWSIFLHVLAVIATATDLPYMIAISFPG